MSEIILDSKAYKHNLHLISSHISSAIEIAPVLKDNAYGHGLAQIASLAAEWGIQSVFVKNQAEAMQVSEYFPHITALYGTPSGDFPSHIAFVIHDRAQIPTLPQGTKIELKVNTGMNRNGIEPHDLKACIVEILRHKLELIGVFCHNGYGNDKDEGFEQIQRCWELLKAEVKHLSQELGFGLPRFHSLSSSGAVRVAMERGISDDLVRLGIASYGYLDVAFANPISPKLKPVASLYADRISTRFLPKGERIGYSGVTALESSHIISTYDIGYGDGFFRVSKPHQAHTAQGYEILPLSSMDCFSCLCDEARICVFDDARPIAKAFNTITYEVLVHLSPFIKRSVM